MLEDIGTGSDFALVGCTGLHIAQQILNRFWIAVIAMDAATHNLVGSESRQVLGQLRFEFAENFSSAAIHEDGAKAGAGRMDDGDDDGADG